MGWKSKGIVTTWIKPVIFSGKRGRENITKIVEFDKEQDDLAEYLVEEDRVVCPPEDVQALAQAIIPTLLDDQFRSKLKVDASRLKNRYSWSAAVSQTMKIYQQLS